MHFFFLSWGTQKQKIHNFLLAWLKSCKGSKAFYDIVEGNGELVLLLTTRGLRVSRLAPARERPAQKWRKVSNKSQPRNPY